MAYEAHLTRADLWVYDKEPITFEEVAALDLPDGFEAVENGTFSDGAVSISLGKCVVYTRPDGVKNFLIFSGGAPSFKMLSEEDAKPFIRLAELLGAKVQGDEGEVYTRDGVQWE
ncbi:MAG: hypothetical protein J5582_14350 [Ruminococcus sp.]|uniref:hypothetical protein n=1 Tax=Ruminococcus sp. TaxID=41978 RepID=UPI0025F039BE|nr:hypothetical protein [Ruminococcus sp.]MBO4867718.1 hypothetical protein [Ruminococcus sp.]